MRLTSRLCFSLIASVAAVSLVLAWYQTRAHTRDLNRELQRNALVLAETLAKSAGSRWCAATPCPNCNRC